METKEKSFPLVGIIMGSDSDLPTMKEAVAVCEEFEVPYEVRIVSAHRTPRDMVLYAESAHIRGLQVIIAGAGGAAHLPGMVASLTPLPVIGVPIHSRSLNGLDSLLSIVQMPSGVPVATVAIGAGRNAGILAIQMVAMTNKELQQEILDFKAKMAEISRSKNHTLPH
ncbi:MAG: 5-(carboxyamino)imidazole ribonucleotide mutase [Acidobacteria bacterium]|nr:5-(carboxyamino)imidazole ribonucleotide mutase [Acidobacteriota bacterium]